MKTLDIGVSRGYSSLVPHGRGFLLVKTVFSRGLWYPVDMYTQEPKAHVDTLRYMLAELLTNQSYVGLTTDQRQWHKRGIDALRASIDAIEVQVYA